MSESQDWRPVVKMIFTAIFTKMKGEVESVQDEGERLQLVLARARAIIDQLPQTVQGVMPLANRQLLEEAKQIMVEAGSEVFGFDLKPRIFEN